MYTLPAMQRMASRVAEINKESRMCWAHHSLRTGDWRSCPSHQQVRRQGFGGRAVDKKIDVEAMNIGQEA